MSVTLFAFPYNIDAVGFYYKSQEEFDEKAHGLTDCYGNGVEEFEIQFIDGDEIDTEMAKAWRVNQVNQGRFFEVINDWDGDQKIKFIIAVGEGGYGFNFNSTHPDDFEIDIYEGVSMKELAEQFIDEGLFGEVPTHLEPYLDYDAISRDLSFDYTETRIAGVSLIYRMH